MALIKCKECGAQVSSKAKACPSCGAKVPKRVGMFGWLFVIFIVLPFVWQIGKSMNNGNYQTKPPSSISSQSPSEAEVQKPEVWKKSEFRDAMTDEKTIVASIKSKNATHFNFPYNTPNGSYLRLNFRRSGKSFDAYLTIDK